MKETDSIVTEKTLYEYDQALESSLEYFNGSEMEATTFLNKYALKTLEDEYLELDPDDMHRRLAREFARIESKYPNGLTEDEIYNYIKNFEKLIPNGSIMAGLGNPFQVMSLSNCFVIGNQSDSYGGILQMDQELVQLMKRRAGVGIDISHLRPRNEPVSNAARKSTGAASFMDRFSDSTREVAQGGRRGALMETIDIRHPDSEEFIDKKMDQTSVTGANISVKIVDEFMEALRNGKDFYQRFPIDSTVEEAKVIKKVDPERIWDKIVENAHSMAEPGILFWDRIIRESPADCYADYGYATLSTNPCGEVPLCPFDSCRLLAMNLFGFVKNPFTEDAYFDFEEFREAARVAQRMMDDVVDLELEHVERIIEKIENDPEPDHIKRTELQLWGKIHDKAQRGRRTGLGLTALGDTLAALGIRYGSDESIEFSEKIVREQKLSAFRSSVEMAKERGSFEIYNSELEQENPFIQRIADEDPQLYREMVKHGRRNIAIMSIAPTGTVSMMAQTTSGVENLFKPFYFRSRKVNPNDENVRVDYYDDVGDAWQEFVVFHHRFEQWLEAEGYDMDEVREMSEEELQEIEKESPYHNATVSDVDWENKVRLQGAIQRHIDHSISVTTNLPEDISVEQVKKVYDVAWEAGCKGQTVYRDGSRSGVLNTKSQTGDPTTISHTDAPKRPEELPCNIHQIRYNGDNWKVMVGFLDDDPYEVFAIKTGGETGVQFRFVNSHGEKIDSGVIRKLGDGKYDLEAEDGKTVIENVAEYAPDDEVRAMTRMLSLSLRHGTHLEFIIDQLEKAEGSILSFSQSVLKALRNYIDIDLEEGVCPKCDETGTLMYVEGCVTCQSCGYSLCS